MELDFDVPKDYVEPPVFEEVKELDLLNSDPSINQALVREIENKAAEKISFGSQDPDVNYRNVMMMKQ